MNQSGEMFKNNWTVTVRRVHRKTVIEKKERRRNRERERERERDRERQREGEREWGAGPL